MSIDELLDVLLHAPTDAAAAQALHVLNGLSRAGDGPATAALLQALGQGLGLTLPAAAALNTSPAGQPAGPGGPVASLPPLLQVYAAALRPAAFLADVQALSCLGASAATVPAFAAFQQLVRSRSVLQHEALKVFVLCALAGVVAMWARAGSPTGRLLGVLDRVRDEAGVVPGANADAALHFGRDLLLRLSGPLALQSVVAHELGHNLLDAVWGAGPALSGPAPDDLSAAQLAALDAALRAAWPRLLQSACQRHGQPVEPGDARGWVSDGGVSLMVTHERLPGGAYFHASLTGQGGPIDLAAGALHAWLLLRQVGVEPMQAALVYSARGMLHLGFRGDAPPPLCPAAPVDAAVADSAAWLAAMRQAGRLGDQEAQIAGLLGVAPPPTTVFGQNGRRTLNDLNLVSWARGADAAALQSLDGDQAAALLGAATRSADPALLQRLLAGRPAGWLRATRAPLAEIGESLCAMRSGGQVALHGPTVDALGQTLQALGQGGADLDAAIDPDCRTLLLAAVARGAAAVRLLLGCGADPNRADSAGQTPLLASAMLGDDASAAALLAGGASVLAQDLQGDSALHLAVRHRHPDLVQRLLAHGAPADARNRRGATPLFDAHDAAMVAALCAGGATVDAAAVDGGTALQQAARTGCTAALRQLLEQGADPDAANRRGETALYWAAAHDADAAALLLEAGAAVDDDSDAGITPLMHAAQHGQAATVQCLLARGADPNARSKTGATALLLACADREASDGDIDAVLGDLVRAGADVDAADDCGQTPLLTAVAHADSRRVQRLLALGADPRRAARDSHTPLALATAGGNDSMIAALTAALAAAVAGDAP